MVRKREVTIAAIYVRVSTEEQGEKNLSIPFQIDTCRHFIEQKEWNLGEVYSDVASGKTDRREEFQRLVEDARKGQFQALVVYKYSRFGRDLVDTLSYERELQRAGVRLVSATEPYDTETVWGWAGKHMMQFFAELENRQKADFVKSGMKQKVQQGGWAWRAPLGYLNRRGYLDGKRRSTWVELDPERAPLIRRCFELAANGDYTLRQICEQVTGLGFRTREGKRLTPKKLLDILRNEFYIGIVGSPTFDVRVKGTHEPLISDELFQRVQVALAMRGRGPKRPHRHHHLFQGIIFCACGRRVNITGPYKGGQSYLRCMSYVNRSLEGCRSLGPKLAYLQRQFEEEVLPSLYVPAADVEEVREELLALSEVEERNADEELRSLDVRLSRQRNRLEKLLEMRLDNELSREEFERKKRELERSIGIMAARETELRERRKQRIASVERVLMVANSLPRLWAEADDLARRELLETVFEKIVIAQKRLVTVILKEPFRQLQVRRGEVPEAFKEAGVQHLAVEEVRAGEA